MFGRIKKAEEQPQVTDEAFERYMAVSGRGFLVLMQKYHEEDMAKERRIADIKRLAYYGKEE